MNDRLSKNPKPDINKDEIEDHIKMIHKLAKGCNGKLCLCIFGEDPYTSMKIKPIVLHYEIGMSKEMFDDVIEYTQKKHHNVYMPLIVIDHSVKKNCKGTKGDIISVLGLCADFDDAQAYMYQDRLPLPADIVIETSIGRFQCMYIFDVPCSPDRAHDVSISLQEHCGCDFGTKDVSHVWRLPGTLNHPNRKKVGAGRGIEPQLVKAQEEYSGTFTSVERLAVSCTSGIRVTKEVDESREDYRLARSMIEDKKSDGEIADAIKKRRCYDEKSHRGDYIDRTIKAAHCGKLPSSKIAVTPATSGSHVLIPPGEYNWACTEFELSNRYKGIEKLYLTGLIEGIPVKLMMNNSGAYSSKLFASWVIAMNRLPNAGEELAGGAFINKVFKVRVETTVPKKVKGTSIESIMRTSIVAEVLELIR